MNKKTWVLFCAMGAVIIILSCFILCNWRIISSRAKCDAYLTLLDSFDNQCVKKMRDLDRMSKEKKFELPTPCRTAREFANDYFNYILDDTTNGNDNYEPFVIGIPNAELAGLIAGQSTGEALLVFGRRPEGGHDETCVIMFPRDGMNLRRYANHPGETNETFPVRAYHSGNTSVNLETLFNCD